MKLECLYAPHRWRENETWFNECADQGLYLEKWESTHITFSDYHSFGFQYWIDVDNGGSTPNSYRQKDLEKLGYEYVTTAYTGYFHVYRAPKGTPDIPDNRKIRKQVGILYNFSNWFILPFYILCFAFYTFTFTNALLNPELINSKHIMSVVICLFLVVNVLIQTLREFYNKIRLLIDLSKPAVHERITLKKPAIKYGILEKYSKVYFFLFLIMSLIIDLL